MKTGAHINWTNILFFTLVPLFAIVGTSVLWTLHAMAWQTWVLALIFAVLMGFSITGGYHRLFSHRSYRGAWPVKLFFAFFGAGAFEGSVLEWSTDHRNHHLYTDTDRDPYNINRGFWYAHIGWLFTQDTSARDFSNVEELAADPIIKWQHRFYVPLAAFVGFVLPMLIAGIIWGDWWGGLIIAGAVRLTFNHHTTFFINSVCHLWGKRTYSDKQTARDNWVTALLTFGEGYHNFHHQFPLDYRNGVRFYDYDPTKWLIRLFSWVGLATDLKRVSDERILRYKLQNDEQRILSHWQHQKEAVTQYISQKVQPLREGIMQLLPHIEQLERDYQALKKSRMNYVRGKMDEYRQHLDAHRAQLKAARRQLKQSLMMWGLLVDQKLKAG